MIFIIVCLCFVNFSLSDYSIRRVLDVFVVLWLYLQVITFWCYLKLFCGEAGMYSELNFMRSGDFLIDKANRNKFKVLMEM